MTNEDKIKLVDLIIDFMSNRTEDKTIVPKNIGTLNIPLGINGYKVAEIGTPIFETHDRYLVMLESLDGKRNVEMTSYKETLKPSIDFYE